MKYSVVARDDVRHDTNINYSVVSGRYEVKKYLVSGSGSYTNYQVKINTTDNKGIIGCNGREVNYYHLEGNLWVNVTFTDKCVISHILTDEDNSNPYNTFDFFSDFETSSIGEGWSIYTKGSGVTVSLDNTFSYHGNKSVKADDAGTAGEGGIERTNSNLGSNDVNVLVFSIAIGEKIGNWRNIMYDSADNAVCTVNFEDGTNALWYNYRLTGELQLVSGPSLNTFYKIKLQFNFSSGTAKIWVNDTYKGERSLNYNAPIVRVLHTTGWGVTNDGWVDLEYEYKVKDPEPSVELIAIEFV